MPSRGQYPFPTHTPSHCASGGSIPTSGASITHTPLQEPPAAHLGQQDYDHASQHLKRDHGSLSSASTDSSRQTAPHPSTDPTLIYAPAFSLSPQAEVGVMGSRRLARAHPNQCTRPSRSEMVEVDGAYHYTYEEDDSSEELQDHAIWVLVWLSLLDPFYCVLAAFISLNISIIILLLAPTRLCKSSWDLSAFIVRFVSPVYRHHLKMLCADSAKDRYDFNQKPFTLIAVYLAAPILSLGVTFAAWISASFWIFAITMGNPDGTERGDDGKAAVLAVRNWWERYLLYAVR